ncbi:piggyBac transposable element-derived protein 4-like [Bactrocera dorsalis]|uniref:PiggyBac transposable element-derived protein 4-like n=1 Tax=Bactrocera dorsalis TaxID=27457 RepID=A0ABM3JHE6_BACDO|nr:piggyBac transposable element-derived protein 4-like [Bactrocera dorsalis]
MSKRSLSQKKLERVVESLSDFSAGSSDEYEPSEDETDSSFEDSEKETASENENEFEYIQGDFQESSTSQPAQNPLHYHRTLENCISRDRYVVLTSKLYFSQPNKPPDATKSYYVDDLISCLKHSFSKCRQDSLFQSIDESNPKFKGRSSLKQYMPMKPIKRGIKLWLRCDADSGYTYDLNVYVGKGTEVSSDALTLGEKVVKRLVGTIKGPDVVLCFDGFFTSVNLLETINFAAVGTCMTNRKNVPSITGKLKRGESKFTCTDTGLMCTKWQDTKEVLLMSNCHKPNVTKISKKDKTGQTGEIDCPEANTFYRQKMGGVDHADQFISLYHHDRKSSKWWKKVFYTCLGMCTTNAWIIYNDLRRKNEKVPYLTYVVNLAEELIAKGKNTITKKRSNFEEKKTLWISITSPYRRCH